MPLYERHCLLMFNKQRLIIVAAATSKHKSWGISRGRFPLILNLFNPAMREFPHEPVNKTRHKRRVEDIIDETTIGVKVYSFCIALDL